MKKERFVDIKNKNNIDTYMFSYDPEEMYYFLKEFSMHDFSKVEFREKVKINKDTKRIDLKSIQSVDEIISYNSLSFPDSNGLYLVKGIGIKTSPFLKTIQKDIMFKGYDLIKPLENTILNLSDFLTNEKSINEDRKKYLTDLYFGLFDIKYKSSIRMDDILKYINMNEVEDVSLWVNEAEKVSLATKNIESHGIKILKDSQIL